MRVVLALAAGALFATGFEPLNLWPLTIISVAACFYLLCKCSGFRETFFVAWCYGIGKFLVGVSWVYVSVYEHGNLHWSVAGFLVFGFVALFALSSVLMGLTFWVLRKRFEVKQPLSSPQLILVFSVAWITYEWITTWVFGGFPWLAAGYVTTHTPLVGLAAVGGVALNSLVVVLVACCLITLRKVKDALILAVGLIALIGVSSIPWTVPGDSIRVAAVGIAISIQEKWQSARQNTLFDRYWTLSQNLEADLIVWPESAIPVSIERNLAAFQGVTGDELSARFLTGQFDVVSDDTSTVLYNSLTLFDGQDPIVYRKQKLVPFGEYTPFQDLLGPAFDFFNFPKSNLRSESGIQPALQVGDWNIVPTICFEIIFPALVNRATTIREGDLIVNVSEDAWFGNSIGPHQHFQVARMRAVEQGRYLIRAANRGISAIVDPKGRVVATMQPSSVGHIEGAVFQMSGITPYSLLPISANLVFVILLLVAIYGVRTLRLGSLKKRAPTIPV